VSEPRVSAVLRADFGGLGTLSREFFDLFGFHRTLSLAFRPDRYDEPFFGTANNRVVAHGRQIGTEDAEWLVDGADAVLSFETFYSAEVPMAAHKRGVRVVLVAMHECVPLGGVANAFVDTVACPHALCLREMQSTPSLQHATKVELPIPFDTDRVPFHRRRRARTFLHYAHVERNGTRETIEAWRYVESDARLIVNCLSDLPEAPRDERIEIRRPVHENYWDGWDEADVLLLPHRFAGLCLPMQHALTAGMPVMTIDFWPFCDGRPLPPATGPIEPDLLARYESNGPGLLPPSSQRLSIEPAAMRRLVVCRPIIGFETTPQAIAAAVDGIFDSDISAVSEEGRTWAEARSFDRLTPSWDVVFTPSPSGRGLG
jgi:hypothetical protein